MSAHPEDAVLAGKLKAHHAAMIKELDRLSAGLMTAAESGTGAASARAALETWIHNVLIPHAEEEEATTYRAAGELPEGRLLIRSMLDEHVLIRQTGAHVATAKNPVAAGAYARALLEIFDSHQRKENDIILPLLVESDAVSLTAVMGGGHHGHGHGHAH
ncbi:MAG: hemerythrin domain-containing protein [Rhodanobacter sp.]|nr:MAG: hemerythrin domain-containing protein [Rhodanobacter sp.]TAM13152.1 MAG: hemerythrin domain-containing protein [Rhodanobacter sp.]TAM35153.1 MAG: hemerythrin domain-containing protein [Rhodanobacter sp.]